MHAQTNTRTHIYFIKHQFIPFFFYSIYENISNLAWLIISLSIFVINKNYLSNIYKLLLRRRYEDRSQSLVVRALKASANRIVYVMIVNCSPARARRTARFYYADADNNAGYYFPPRACIKWGIKSDTKIEPREVHLCRCDTSRLRPIVKTSLWNDRS